MTDNYIGTEEYKGFELGVWKKTPIDVMKQVIDILEEKEIEAQWSIFGENSNCFIVDLYGPNSTKKSGISGKDILKVIELPEKIEKLKEAEFFSVYKVKRNGEYKIRARMILQAEEKKDVTPKVNKLVI